MAKFFINLQKQEMYTALGDEPNAFIDELREQGCVEVDKLTLEVMRLVWKHGSDTVLAIVNRYAQAKE